MVDGRVKEGLTLELNKLNRELLLALMLADLEGDEDDDVVVDGRLGVDAHGGWRHRARPSAIL